MTTSSFMSTVPARELSTAGSLRISALSDSWEVMIIDSPFTAAGAPCKRNVLPSRCCGESRRNGFSERRFKDGDVLLNGATAYADARDQLAVAGERRSAAH